MRTSPHILVVDDDREIRDLLGKFLDKNGFRVTTAADGREMKQALDDWKIDLIVLDLMLPGEDGLMLCRRLRAESSLPVIMLTAMSEEVDRIVGLEMGADDYITKPFSPRELVARIKAVLRRASAATETGIEVVRSVLQFAGWRLDLDRRELYSTAGVLVPLSSGEFDLLATFATHAGRVLSRDQLLDLARGRAAQPFDRSIDVQVSRLRQKVEDDPKTPTLIKTVRNGGYIFTPTVVTGEKNGS